MRQGLPSLCDRGSLVFSAMSPDEEEDDEDQEDDVDEDDLCPEEETDHSSSSGGEIVFAWANRFSQSSIVFISAGAMRTPPL